VRITIQHIFDNQVPEKTARAANLWKALDSYLGRFASYRVELEQMFLERSTGEVYNRFYEHQNETYIVESLAGVEEDGSDAAVIACIADPGLGQARSLLSMPVVGAGEASLALSQFLGKRFAVVVVRPEVVPMVERRLDALQAYGRAIPRPVRSIEQWSYDNLVDGFEDRNSLILDEFERVARECITDGADVIVSGCAYVGPLITEKNLLEIPGTGVPVIDCTGAAIEMAILMARMRTALPGLGPSRALHGPYCLPKSSELQRPQVAASP
jgi:allantoin racemase